MPSGEVRVCREEPIAEKPLNEEPEFEDGDAAHDTDDKLRPREVDESRRWTFANSAQSPRHNLNYHRNRPRSSTMVRLGASGLPPHPKSKPWPTHRRSESDLGSRGRGVFLDNERFASERRGRQTFSRPPRSSASLSFSMRRPDSSNGSTSTVVQTPHRPERGAQNGESALGSARRASVSCEANMSPSRAMLVPDALKYLDEDSPEVTEDAIRRSVEAAGTAPSAPWHHAPSLGYSGSSNRGSPCRPSHRMTSPYSSGMSSAASATSCSEAVGEDRETDRSSSPERSVNCNGGASGRVSPVKGDSPAAPELREPRNLQELQELEQEISRQHHRRYGTPEMPRGNANIPPRLAKSRGSPQPAMNLPRAEKLPLSGYELLASCLSGPEHCLGWHESDHNQHQPQQGQVRRAHRRHASLGSSVGSAGMPTPSPWAQQHQQHPSIKPIYRRFQALNHRVLLNLQDELSVLEEQLHRLDTADTQARRMQSHILPASRRGDNPRGGELQIQKTEVLQKIEAKLGQYNQALESFTKTQGLPVPSAKDVDNYRTYFTMENPISEMETRFLDCPYDLISLSPDEKPPGPVSFKSPAATPRHRRDDLPLRHHHYGAEYDKQDQPSDDNGPMPARGRSPFRAGSPTPTILYYQRPEAVRSPFATARPSPLSQPPTNAANASRHRRFGSSASNGSPGLASCLSSSYPTEPAQPTSTMSLLEEAEPKSETGVAVSGGVVCGVSAGAAAILAPVSAFTIVPGFAARMAVVLTTLVLAAVLCSGWSRWSSKDATENETAQATTESSGETGQEGKQTENGTTSPLTVPAAPCSMVGGFSTRDLLLCAGAYGGVMAVIAGAFV